MSIDVIESEWVETILICKCGWHMFTDGKHRPQCGNQDCLEMATDEQIWNALISVEDAE